MVEYAAATTDEANKITATATDPDADISIMLGSDEIENGSNATWAEGENDLTITVSLEDHSTEYAVTVTYTPGA